MWVREAREVWVLVRGATCNSMNTRICILVTGEHIPCGSRGPGPVRSVTCAVSPLPRGKPLNPQAFPATLPQRFPSYW